MGIPLRPDPTALAMMERRSFHRACAAMVMGQGRDTRPETVLKNSWNDSDAHVILRAAQNPLMTTGTFPQIQSTKILPMLSPDSASSKLLAMGANLDLTGIATIKVPFIGGAGRPAQPAFIAEGSPIPVINLATSAMTLGPVCKIAIASAVSMELQEASAETPGVGNLRRPGDGCSLVLGEPGNGHRTCWNFAQCATDCERWWNGRAGCCE
jgi:hypothetical protein